MERKKAWRRWHQIKCCSPIVENNPATVSDESIQEKRSGVFQNCKKNFLITEKCDQISDQKSKICWPKNERSRRNFRQTFDQILQIAVYSNTNSLWFQREKIMHWRYILRNTPEVSWDRYKCVCETCTCIKSTTCALKLAFSRTAGTRLFPFPPHINNLPNVANDRQEAIFARKNYFLLVWENTCEKHSSGWSGGTNFWDLLLSFSLRFNFVNVQKISLLYLLLITKTFSQVFLYAFKVKNYTPFVITGSRGKASKSMYVHSLSFVVVRLVVICIHLSFVSFLSLHPIELTYPL